MIVVLVALLSAFMFLMAPPPPPPPPAPVQFGRACVTNDADVDLSASRFVLDLDGGAVGSGVSEFPVEAARPRNP